jgi:hypothetical protein
MIRIHGVKKALTHISVKLVTHAVSKWRGIYHVDVKKVFPQKFSFTIYSVDFLIH